MMTPEHLQRIKTDYADGFYPNAGVIISQLITELEYQTAANEHKRFAVPLGEADRIIIGLRVANERLTAELAELRAGLDGLLAKLRDDEVAELRPEPVEGVVRVTGHSEPRPEEPPELVEGLVEGWPGE